MASRSWAARAILAALLLLVPGRPAQAFDYDTHYLWTYYLALHVGYSPRQAYQIASATFAVDYDPNTEPMGADKMGLLMAAPDDKTEKIWLRFHAFGDREVYRTDLLDKVVWQGYRSLPDTLGGLLDPTWNLIFVGTGDLAAMRERRDGQAQVLWKKALEEGNPGPYLHFIQDIYSHWDFDSRRGHLFASHVPDFLANNRGRSMAMTRDTIDALERFADASGIARRRVDWAQIERVLDRLIDVNPPVTNYWPGHYDELLQWALDGVKSYFDPSVHMVFPVISGAGAPDRAKAMQVIRQAIAADRMENRIPSLHHTSFDLDLPDKWYQYKFQPDSSPDPDPENRERFPVEFPEIVWGQPQLSCTPETAPATGVRLHVRLPYDIRGVSTLGGAVALQVTQFFSDTSDERRDVTTRVNGRYQFEAFVVRPQEMLTGQSRWTITYTLGPNERAVTHVPLQCGSIPIPAQPPRLPAPPPRIACPASPSLGPGRWDTGAVSSGLFDGTYCRDGSCAVACKYGDYPAPGHRRLQIVWDTRDAESCRIRDPGGLNVSRTLYPELESRDPEGKRLLDELEAAVAPYAWRCPTRGAPTATVQQTSWTRPAAGGGDSAAQPSASPTTGRGVFDPNDRRSVPEILASGGTGRSFAFEAGAASGVDVTPPSGQSGTVRMAFGGRVVEATYQQEADQRGVAIDTYYYPTPQASGGTPPGDAQRWSRFVRVPSVRASVSEPVVWWHVHWEYGAQGWAQVQEQGVAPPQGVR